MLHLPRSLAGEFCVWVKVQERIRSCKGTINDSGAELT